MDFAHVVFDDVVAGDVLEDDVGEREVESQARAEAQAIEETGQAGAADHREIPAVVLEDVGGGKTAQRGAGLADHPRADTARTHSAELPCGRAGEAAGTTA